eukprot:345907-Pleurochrysis_carterae.AAC.1
MPLMRAFMLTKVKAGSSATCNMHRGDIGEKKRNANAQKCSYEPALARLRRARAARPASASWAS